MKNIFNRWNPIEYDLVEYRGDYLVYRLGLTVTGRKARVACYNLPKWFMENASGSIQTSGHTFTFN